MDFSQIGFYAQLFGGLLLFMVFFSSIGFGLWIFSIHRQYGNKKLIVCRFREHNHHLTTESHIVGDDGTFTSDDPEGHPMGYMVDTKKVWYDDLPGGVPAMFRIPVATIDYFRGKAFPLDPLIHDDDAGAAAFNFASQQKLYSAAFQFFARQFGQTLQKVEIILIVLICVGIVATAGSGYMAMQAQQAATTAAHQTAELMDLIQNGPKPMPSGTPVAPLRPASLAGGG